ncbi:hypothetical protein, partial [Staphylococcus sp. GDY8P86P]|uniref:hypothetical protein n=1 Tax=Staphylococcus sp. GDY8P86P TaxID=2804139 RepID=UPI001AEC403B
ISEDDYKQRSALAARLEPEYKRLNSGEERKQDKEHINHLKNKNLKLEQQNKKLKNERDEVVRDKKLTMSLVQHGCKVIKENVGENVYHKGINMIDNRVKDKYKAKFRDMVSVDDSDKRMFKQKDNEINRKQFQEQIQNNKVRGKDKGFDLDR